MKEKLEVPGIKEVRIDSEYYPVQLKSVPIAPNSIYVKGNIELLKSLDKSISIVGTRHPDKYGVENAKYFSCYFAKLKIPIISGLALGIDSIAHTEALKLNSPTIAVIPGSIDNIYPKVHTKLANEIIKKNGLVISEYALNKEVNSKSFERRNRIIAGLTPVTLVIESKIHGGSMITTRLAFDFDREVFAIPGDINNLLMEGCNRLISEKRKIAKLITKPEDIMEWMGW